MQTFARHIREEFLTPWTAPRDGIDARFRVDLLKAGIPGSRVWLALVFTPMCAAIALPWVHDGILLAAWAAAGIAYPIFAHWAQKTWVLAKLTPQHVHIGLAKTAILEMPFHLLWLLYVPICWQGNDPANNAFLTIFMIGTVTSAVRRYGPCTHLAMPVLALFVPFCIAFSIKTGTTMDVVIPILQIAYLGLLYTMSMRNAQSFRESFDRLRTIETLVLSLSDARDEAERANKAKSAFLASMSHELRTPLNAIIGFSDMIRHAILGPVSPPKYREYAEDINTGGQHLLALINDVLDLSKIEAGKRELSDSIIDLIQLTDNALLFVRPQAEKAETILTLDFQTTAKLRADERATSQILVNFLSNAIKFSRAGDSIIIFAHRTGTGGLALGVEDHGVGMDQNGIRKALEPYGQVSLTTRDSVGTGLGLPIAKALVEAHQATFHIESELGVGTTIWATYPPERVVER